MSTTEDLVRVDRTTEADLELGMYAASGIFEALWLLEIGPKAVDQHRLDEGRDRLVLAGRMLTRLITDRL